MSRFWDLYEKAKPGIAGAVDDVRHTVVEEGWFGKQTTGNVASPADETKSVRTNINVNADSIVIGDNSVHNGDTVTQTNNHAHYNLYESIWGREPSTPETYGQGGTGPDPVASSPTAAPAPSASQDLDPDL